MKFFLVEGILTNPEKLNDEIMAIHKSYTQKAMDDGFILMSGLKSDMSGGLFIIKSDSIEKLESYLSSEPFKVNGIQDYRYVEFSAHYINEHFDKWINN